MLEIHLHNTLTKRKEKFVPIDPKHITLYVCGPTVYNYVHIGNGRPMVIFDILFRLLQINYPKVTYVRNITDVDDKINQAAQAQGESISEFSQRYAVAFQEDMQALNMLPPSIEPLATQHIPEMIQMIETLIEQGHAYEAEGHALFHVSSWPQYGKLSNRDPADLLAGARVEVAPYKKDPGDFVLWKPSTPDLPGWDSPWGRGRPGWHIECSAMIRKHLGANIDIHGGGQDLIFPHHENELAQSCACDEHSTYVNYWMHNGYLTISGEKMSKSLGNFLTIHELLETHPGETLRYTLLSAQYRSPLDFGDNTLSQAQASLDRLYNALRGSALETTPAKLTSNWNKLTNKEIELDNQVLAALSDDLNTSLALTRLHEIANEIFKSNCTKEKEALQHKLSINGHFLGILTQDSETWFKQRYSGTDEQWDEVRIENAIQEREAARANKDYAGADKIRKELKAAGIELEDAPSGTRWHRIS